MIFLFGSSELYYFIVEIGLFFQCVYVALWATNFVPIAVDSNKPIMWQIILLLPLPINFFILKQIIFSSCLLKSIFELNREIVDKICEDAFDELQITQKIRKAIKKALKDNSDIESSIWPIFLKERFSHYINKDDKGVTEKKLKSFLHSLQVFLTDSSIKIIFNVIDSDKDGIVSWKDLYPIIFPELQKRRNNRPPSSRFYNIDNIKKSINNKSSNNINHLQQKHFQLNIHFFQSYFYF